MPTRWKAFERECAAALGGKRYPANMGGPVDIESEFVVGQCKEVATFSLQQLTEAVEKIEQTQRHNHRQKSGMVLIRHKQGRGKPRSPTLVVMTLDTFTGRYPQ